MKHLKKLIYKHNKLLFSITTILCILLSTFTSVCAWDDPNKPGPTGPVFDTPTYAEIPIHAYFNDLFLYNVNAEYKVYKYPDFFEFTVPLDFYQDDVVINSQIDGIVGDYRNTIRSRKQYVLDVPYHVNTLRCNFPADHEYISTQITFSPFWFIPYTDLDDVNGKQMRRICMIRVNEGLKESYPYLLINIHVKYSFMGNNKVYEDTITTTLSDQSAGGFNFTYEEITGDYDNVPLYIHDMYIELPDFIADALSVNRNNWIDVYIPIATLDELNGNELNNYYLYNNTIHYSTEFDLDLEWIIDGVQGFLNAELFLGITFGGIFMLAITCTLAIFVLKMLNHLK